MTKVTEHHAQRLMDYFPVQMKVSGQKIIFCGGQQEVLAKVRLLIKTFAELLVFAPAFCEGLLDLSGHPRLRLIDRFPQDEDFDGAVLCYLGVENDAELKQLKASAARQHVAVCAIDNIFPHLTDMAAIAIEFPSVTDGRGFSFSRLIREAGFTSRLRAVGLLLPHQFRHLLQTGFDEYLASEKTTVRFPEPLWIEQVETSAISYQDRLSDSSAFSQKIPSIGEYKGRDRRVQRRYDRCFRG